MKQYFEKVAKKDQKHVQTKIQKSEIRCPTPDQPHGGWYVMESWPRAPER